MTRATKNVQTNSASCPILSIPRTHRAAPSESHEKLAGIGVTLRGTIPASAPLRSIDKPLHDRPLIDVNYYCRSATTISAGPGHVLPRIPPPPPPAPPSGSCRHLRCSCRPSSHPITPSRPGRAHDVVGAGARCTGSPSPFKVTKARLCPFPFPLRALVAFPWPFSPKGAASGLPATCISLPLPAVCLPLPAGRVHLERERERERERVRRR